MVRFGDELGDIDLVFIRVPKFVRLIQHTNPIEYNWSNPRRQQVFRRAHLA